MLNLLSIKKYYLKFYSFYLIVFIILIDLILRYFHIKSKDANTMNSDDFDLDDLKTKQFGKRLSKNNDKTKIYSEYIGQNKIFGAQKDNFGNAQGNQYDLARDSAFKDVQIAVLQLFTGEGFNFTYPTSALQEKGFNVVFWQNMPPPVAEFEKVLKKSSQLWLISSSQKILDNQYIDIIINFYNEGHGLYLWGDNEPYYIDANLITERLFDVSMKGNVFGDNVVSIQTSPNSCGFIANHPITTGLEYLYEGVTIATIEPNSALTPLLYGSANNLVAAFYDKNGRRAIIDGGFTKLYIKWNTAGTGRYIKNAASWLVNYEKIGDKIFQKGY